MKRLVEESVNILRGWGDLKEDFADENPTVDDDRILDEPEKGPVYVPKAEQGDQYDVSSAESDIKGKSEQQLEVETAEKWAARAIVCFKLAAVAGNDKEKFKWFDRGDDNRHEALEHAALAGDHGETVKRIQTDVDKFRDAVGIET